MSTKCREKYSRRATAGDSPLEMCAGHFPSLAGNSFWKQRLFVAVIIRSGVLMSWTDAPHWLVPREGSFYWTLQNGETGILGIAFVSHDIKWTILKLEPFFLTTNILQLSLCGEGRWRGRTC